MFYDKAGDFYGAWGRAKDDLNQRTEIEGFISFLGYQTELLGSAFS